MKSSFEIEHIKPSSTLTERFVALLQLAEREDFSEKTKLIDLQNNGRLSGRKRATHYNFLSEDEIVRMEQAIQSAYGSNML